MPLRRDLALKLFLALVWLVCLYRAITQAIVHDEALTYHLYIAAPFSTIFQFFDANHHFLNTLLMKVSVSLFGASEWSMRLPALAGAALYFAAVYRICAREIRTFAVSLAAASLLVLNPFILDFMVAARGYGMAMGLWMWALAVLIGYLRKPDPDARRDLLRPGRPSASRSWRTWYLSIPAAALVMVSWAVLKSPVPAAAPEPGTPHIPKKRRNRRKRPSMTSQDRALQSFWRWVVVPALVGCVVLFLVFPIGQRHRGQLLRRGRILAASLHSLYDVSLAHGGPLRQAVLRPGLRDGIAFGLAPAMLAFGLALGIRRRDVLLLLPCAVAVLCGVLLLALHLAVNLLYPFDRTGIYFLPLLALALAGLAEGTGLIRIAAWTVSALLVGQFLLEFDTRKFALWDYDADTPAILRELAKAAPDRRANSVRVANSWQLEPSLNFYAARYQLTWLQPITRAGITTGADYYILMGADREAIRNLHLKPFTSGQTLEPSSRPPPDNRFRVPPPAISAPGFALLLRRRDVSGGQLRLAQAGESGKQQQRPYLHQQTAERGLQLPFECIRGNDVDSEIAHQQRQGEGAGECGFTQARVVEAQHHRRRDQRQHGMIPARAQAGEFPREGGQDGAVAACLPPTGAPRRAGSDASRDEASPRARPSLNTSSKAKAGSAPAAALRKSRRRKTSRAAANNTRKSAPSSLVQAAHPARIPAMTG